MEIVKCGLSRLLVKRKTGIRSFRRSRTRLGSRLLFIATSCYKRLAKNSAQLIGFNRKLIHSCCWQQIRSHDEINPTASLTEFLQRNTYFVNEVPAAFGRACFFVVRSGGCAAANQLPCDMLSKSRFR